ncbi:two-component system chemotaxis response regulator CheY [Lysinibacillus composti]|uniref:Response regulator n=1 Tax=Lysinibacillus composti TaxID=720633 RepID=A0A3N9UAA7_9BACI|nr:response regulator [Lysinibacillus composti]MBM7609933.1 two-component system chemotaxis response regulator CheY [Lysinibacillus composti]RQW73463.1 response regulator [Lysinibacillus composti]
MPTVLVVDDALFMRASVGNMFREWGFEVIGEASDGREAVELYKEFQPDLVTMDLTMPVMSGFDALKEIIQQFPNANVIMITALGQQRVIVDALEAGAKDFIAKPFEALQLKAVVQNVLGSYEM